MSLEGNLIQEPQQVVWLRTISVRILSDIFPACPVRLVQNHALIFQLLQQLRSLCPCSNQSLRDDADSAWALKNTSDAVTDVIKSVFVPPALSCPDSGRHIQHGMHLILPLIQQGLRNDDQNRSVTIERHQLCRHGKLQGFSQTYHVRQHQPRTALRSMFFKSTHHEILLVRPQPEFTAVNRLLCGDGSRISRFFLPPFFNSQRMSVCNSFDVRNHKLAQRDSTLMIPEIIKLRLHPVCRRRIIILPDDLIVAHQSTFSLIHAANKGQTPTVGVCEDAGFAMHQAIHAVRQDADLHFPTAEKIV